MARLQWSPLWLIPSGSLSPLDTLKQMSKGNGVTLISGADDPLTLPEYVHDYVAKAKSRGTPVTMVTIPGKGHAILLEPAVIEFVAQIVQSKF